MTDAIDSAVGEPRRPVQACLAAFDGPAAERRQSIVVTGDPGKGVDRYCDVIEEARAAIGKAAGPNRGSRSTVGEARRVIDEIARMIDEPPIMHRVPVT
jgi:hypothetical protein